MMSLGTAGLFLGLGQVSRKLCEALGGKPWFYLFYISSMVALTSPMSVILLTDVLPSWYSTQMVVAFVVSIPPTWIHWHWLFTGRDR